MNFYVISMLAAALLLPVGARAADWAGPYVGANAGYGAGSSHVATRVGAPGSFIFPADAKVINAAGAGTLSPSGFVGGLSGGMNWQRGGFVYGLEADFDSFHLTAARSAAVKYVTFPTFSARMDETVDTSWLFTVRPRVGWSVKDALLYATGGLAITNLRTTNSFVSNFPVPGTAEAATPSANKTGWVLGLGGEYALGARWSMKAEYLHADFGGVSGVGSVGTSPSTVFVHSADLHAEIVRAGVNYRF